MPTLHSVTENTKKLLKIGSVIVLAISLIFLLYRGGVFIKDYFFPTPPPPPTVTFGKLTPVTFPKSLPTNNLTFVVDTVTGELPLFLDTNEEPMYKINVYKIFNPEFSLLDLQNAKAIVSKIGFSGRETPHGTNRYQWNALESGLQKTIDMNIVNKTFAYSSSFMNLPRVRNGERMPDLQSSIRSSKDFLETMGLFPQDIDETRTRTEALRITENDLQPVQTLRDAQIIRVDFYQKEKNDFPIYYTAPPHSSIHFYITSGERFDPEVVQGMYYHQLITDESATYPLKPVEKAFEQLQAGKGYIGSNFTKENPIKIKEVLLGYYASSDKQDYLVPIYIFKGLSDEFYAYVTAVSDEWFAEKSLEVNDN